MSALARESLDGGGAPIPVVGHGTVQRVTVDTGQSYAQVAIGTAPDVTASYFTVPAGVPEYFRVIPGVSKVEAKAGSTTAETASAVGAHTTAVRIFYDPTAGKVEVMEGLQ
jgi:hypothetical protein